MQKIDNLKQLYVSWAGEEVTNFNQLPLSGSARKYYRLQSRNKSAIGVYNTDAKENSAFLSFTRHFFRHGLSVPEIYATQEEECIYLLQDLGDTTLYQMVTSRKADSQLSAELELFYRNAITELLKFQIVAGKDLDYTYCYPRQKFDRQSMMWDLHYFKYYFLKPNGIIFDEQFLEHDFIRLADYLEKVPSNYFMFRDFQSRNILVNDNKLFFIDYQGGRKGALQYDLASLLFQAKAGLSPVFREEMLKYYVNELKNYISVDEVEFTMQYYTFVLVRLLQVSGAYGFRGYFEKKAHFLQSIPSVLKQMQWFNENIELPVSLTELMVVMKEMAQLKIDIPSVQDSIGLTVSVNSFSYKNGIPVDYTGNGGGFVFDCRSLPNPGRLQEYKNLTGKDKPVIDILEGNPDVEHFLSNIFGIVDQSVEIYLNRKFNHLQINFGCTGGQHRSVYCAMRLFDHLLSSYPVNVIQKHFQIGTND
jgi:aminoglycoside/choline kinase family phosphotransferase